MALRTVIAQPGSSVQTGGGIRVLNRRSNQKVPKASSARTPKPAIVAPTIAAMLGLLSSLDLGGDVVVVIEVAGIVTELFDVMLDP